MLLIRKRCFYQKAVLNKRAFQGQARIEKKGASAEGFRNTQLFCGNKIPDFRLAHTC